MGAGIARDAALRGLSVALVEQNDFVSGTSSKTTKLIHGGLRYLEQIDFGLVRRALHERKTLLTLAPHLVRPLPFLVPVFSGGRRPAWKVRLGVTLYDALAGDAKITPHKFYSGQRSKEIEPVLSGLSVSGSAEYADAQMNDVRLCLENIFGAEEAGAVVLNHAKVVGFKKEDGKVIGAEIVDQMTSKRYDLRATVIINTAGPWADAVRRLSRPDAQPLMRRSKGIHVVYPRLPIQRAMVLSTPKDGRIYFLVPWKEWTLIGTTDTDFDASPDRVSATADEVAYLLEETNKLLPKLCLNQKEIVTTFAGVRPLVDGGQKVPWQLSRGHLVHTDPDGLVTLAGGKYTTYRYISEQVVDGLLPKFNRQAKRCQTTEVPLGFRREWRSTEEARLQLRDLLSRGLLHPETVRNLIDLYGVRAHSVADIVRKNPQMAQTFCHHHPHIQAQVVYAVEQESAVSLSDLFWRRLEVGWASCQGLDCAETAARLMAERFGWEVGEVARQVERYRTEVGENHSF